MKVLLIQAFLGKKEPLVYPLGLSYIATALSSRRHEVYIIDPNISDEPNTYIEKNIKGFEPDIVGISLRNIDNQERRNFFYHFKYLEPLIKNVKKLLPDTPIVLGGAGFSMFAETIMKRFPEIDFGVYLEGEESFPQLLDDLNNPERVSGVYYRKGDTIAFTGIRGLPDFSKMPIPRKDFIDIKKYAVHRDAIGIQTKRGCAYRCCYCTYYNLNGNKIRMRKPEHVIDEIEELYTVYKINSFMFADALFNIPLEHASNICKEIIRRDLRVEWSCWCEPKNITKEFLLLAKKAGCRFIAYSPDALSDDALRVLQKNISKKDIEKVYRYAREVDGIRTEFGFFVSPPGETLLGLLNTVWFFVKANFILVLKRKGAAGLNWIRIEPDTMIYNIAKKEGIIKEDLDLLPDETTGQELFYTQPFLKKYNVFIDTFLSFVDFVKGRKGKSIVEGNK